LGVDLKCDDRFTTTVMEEINNNNNNKKAAHDLIEGT